MTPWIGDLLTNSEEMAFFINFSFKDCSFTSYSVISLLQLYQYRQKRKEKLTLSVH